MKLYHYTKPEHREGIKNGSNLSDGEPGLAASKVLFKEYSDPDKTKALFALFEPAPTTWTNHMQFWNMLKDRLLESTWDLLLEINLPANYEGYVMNREHMETFIRDKSLINPKNNPEYRDDLWANKPARKIPYMSRAEAEAAYALTRIPLADYNQAIHQFGLTEVVIPTMIPIENINISPTQNILEARFKNKRHELLNYFNTLIQIPELEQILPPAKELFAYT